VLELVTEATLLVAIVEGEPNVRVLNVVQVMMLSGDGGFVSSTKGLLRATICVLAPAPKTPTAVPLRPTAAVKDVVVVVTVLVPVLDVIALVALPCTPTWVLVRWDTRRDALSLPVLVVPVTVFLLRSAGEAVTLRLPEAPLLIAGCSIT
jgi:hypothetical protein